jgi:lactoylglutathione lyase
MNNRPAENTKGVQHMSALNSNQPILELRVALTARDYQKSLVFYSKALGIEPSQFWNNGQGQAAILEMGNATLEIFDEMQADTIDEIEVGKRVSGQVRFALQVPNLELGMERLLAHGAKKVHSAVVTPWGDRNVRFEDPDGMQITLFERAEQQDQA